MPSLGELIGSGYGNRVDGTPKANGYFGKLERPDGDFSTELSFGFNTGGKEVLAPLIVPTLSLSEINHLLSGEKPTQEIYKKASDFAVDRLRSGKSPFAKPNEVVPLPADDAPRRLEDVISGARVPNPNPVQIPPPMIGRRG